MVDLVNFRVMSQSLSMNFTLTLQPNLDKAKMHLGPALITMVATATDVIQKLEDPMVMIFMERQQVPVFKDVVLDGKISAGNHQLDVAFVTSDNHRIRNQIVVEILERDPAKRPQSPNPLEEYGDKENETAS